MIVARKDGLLLSSDSPSSLELFKLQCRRLLNQGHHVYVYLLHTAVRHFQDNLLQDLASERFHPHLCSLAAEKHGIAFSEKAVFCGLGTLASIIRNTDSFTCFSRHSRGLEQAQSGHPVLLIAEDLPEEPSGDTVETLRVAAGLAQLSGLQVHLQVRGPALSLFSGSPVKPDRVQESLQYLRLLEEAGGTVYLSGKQMSCPVSYLLTEPNLEQSLILRIG